MLLSVVGGMISLDEDTSSLNNLFTGSLSSSFSAGNSAVTLIFRKVEQVKVSSARHFFHLFQLLINQTTSTAAVLPGLL